jgi:hypothetical protein
MLATVVLAGGDAVEEVDWARACADEARTDAIRTRKRAEKTVEDAIVYSRCREEMTTSVRTEQRVWW